MKPAPFEYHAPDSVEEALALLAQHGDDAKVLAGGQSLVPMLNFRLAQPAHIVDVNRIRSLAYVRRAAGRLRVGAMTRQSVLEASGVAARHWPLLTEALEWIAHPQIRNRGTVGGSLAHADPAAELAVAGAALDVRLHARSQRGARTISWRDFWVTHFTTSLMPDELLVEIEIPPLPRGSGWGFAEYARRHGDFALGGAAVVVCMDGNRCRDARIALLAASDTPIRAAQAEQSLAGSEINERAVAGAAALAVADVRPTGDAHAGAEYRRTLIEAMVRKALRQAADRARR